MKRKFVVCVKSTPLFKPTGDKYKGFPVVETGADSETRLGAPYYRGRESRKVVHEMGKVSYSVYPLYYAEDSSVIAGFVLAKHVYHCFESGDELE